MASWTFHEQDCTSQARSQAWANPGSARVAQETARVARDWPKIIFICVTPYIFSRCASLKITSLADELECHVLP
jgi:hypothetical protein